MNLTFGVPIQKSGGLGLLNSPIEFAPFENGKYDRSVILDENNSAQDALKALIEHLTTLPCNVSRIGIGSYGPLLSVNTDDREAGNPNYGTISSLSKHALLSNLKVYAITKETLDECGKNIEVIVQTDVTCGALLEVYTRLKSPTLVKPFRQHKPRDLLVFLNIAEGVGGAFISGLKPTKSALHPEMGYIPAQVLDYDEWGKSLITAPPAPLKPIFIEELVSYSAMQARVGNNDLYYVSMNDWHIAGEYIAQLCAVITTILSPHQIVLHGPLIDIPMDHTGRQMGLMGIIRQKFRNWLTSKGQQYINYKEIENPHLYLDCSSETEWTHDDGIVYKIDPMLAGSLILAIQPDLREKSGK